MLHVVSTFTSVNDTVLCNTEFECMNDTLIYNHTNIYCGGHGPCAFSTIKNKKGLSTTITGCAGRSACQQSESFEGA